MLDTILNSDAVSFEEEHLDVADLVLLGLITGLWAPFEREASRGVALQRDTPGGVGAQELKRRATEFRYERRLLSASEFTAWLAARALTVADLSGVLTRALLRERTREQDADVDVEVEDRELARSLRAEALCGSLLKALADTAIDRLAAAHRLGLIGSECTDERVQATLVDATERRASGIAALGEDRLRRRLQRLWAYEDAHTALRQQVAEPAALSQRLADHGLDWLCLQGTRLRLAREGAAREARALISEDGLGVEQVAVLAGVPAASDSLYLDEVPEKVAGALAATAPGEVSAPWLADERWNLLVVSAKTAPSLEDRVLRERAADELLAEVLRRQAAGRATVRGVF